MLLEIIKGYAAPTRDDLFADAGIEEPRAVTADNQNNDINNQADKAQDKNSQNANSEIEDDDDPEV